MTENEYKQLQEVFEGRYVEIRDTFPESENGPRPPMNIIPPNQFHFGSPGCGGNGQHTDVYGFISIKDFESAIKALSDIKSSLDRICSLLENGGISFHVEGK